MSYEVYYNSDFAKAMREISNQNQIRSALARQAAAKARGEVIKEVCSHEYST